jgi:hypothetical protein
MCNRCTSTCPSSASSGSPAQPEGTQPAVQYRPPRQWLPNPVSRVGAVFYAVVGAALYEGAVYVAHHVQIVITLV